MSAFGPKQTWTVALHMSAFGGKADIAPALQMSAYDPKRTSVTITATHRELSTAMADHPTEARAISKAAGRPGLFL